jgi:hypothetical protein
MKNILKLRILICSVVALLASGCVVVYNNVQVGNELTAHRHLMGLAVIFIKLQWWVFIIPIVGICMGVKKRASNRNLILRLLPDLLTFFAFGWVLMALIIWNFQLPPIMTYPGFR